MKWFYNLASEIIKTVELIFNENKQGDKVVNNLLKSKKKWGSRDRRFVAKVLYDIIRWKILYENISNSDILTNNGKWNILATWSILNNIDLPDWKEFALVDKQKIINNFNALHDEKIKQSVPYWLFNEGVSQLGKEKWVKELKALNNEAEVVLRVNTLQTSVINLKNILLKEQIETFLHKEYPDALFLSSRRKLTHLKAYQKGLFEIQDASSQLVARFSGAKKGQIVIDACAGAGGKTLHLASVMENKGAIYAYDIYQSKIDELNKRAKRNKVTNIVKSAVISKKIVKNNFQIADILLIDAPCSSIGTLKRKPDLKWKLNPDKLMQINVIQKDILNNYETMLKPGGHLIYVTCSIFPNENQENVKHFLSKHKNYTFVEDKTVFPSESIGDGFYMAKLLKTQ